MTPATEKIPCSVAVLTFNSERGLRRCLESVSQFEQIIVCDGGSTDETLKIAAEFGCTLIEQDPAFKGSDNRIIDFSGVRNQTLEVARNSWFLILDSDEYLSEALVTEVREIVAIDTATPQKQLFHVLRKFEVEGEIIACAGTYPSYQPRLFNRNAVVRFSRKLHERIISKEGYEWGYTKTPMIVPVSIDMSILNKKFQYYLAIEYERNTVQSIPQLLKSIFFNVKAVMSRWIKIFRNSLFCRGKKMPLSFEWVSTVYTLRVIVILLTILIKKI